jgi:hypothetical protein
VQYAGLTTVRATFLAIICGAALAGTAPMPFPPTAQAQPVAKPFEGMEGSWSGAGTVTLGSGDKERIRCRVNYTVNDAGNRVAQDLKCASDSYKFELEAEIIYSNGAVSGNWSERNMGTNGRISGTASPGQINALAESNTFAATFSMTTRGDRHSVRIDSKSKEISNVTITLRRTGS